MHLRITVSLADLLGTVDSEGSVPRWLAYALGAIALGLVLLVCVIFCMKKQLFCFEGSSCQWKHSDDIIVGDNSPQAQYLEEKKKQGYVIRKKVP